MPGSARGSALNPKRPPRRVEALDCGRAPWGAIPVEPNTQYVDASYAAPDADGSSLHPWPTIAKAYEAAQPAAVIAIAQGDYAENLAIQNKPVRIWGRCPSLVTVTGSAPANQAIIVRAGADGTEIRGIAVTGPGMGIALSGSQNLILEQLWVRDAGVGGIEAVDILGATSVEIAGSLIEGAGAVGVHGGGVTVAIRDSVVRATLAPLSENGGYGVSMELGPTSSAASTLDVRRTVIEQSHSIGIQLLGSHATIDSTLIRDGQPQPDGTFGRGISAELEPQTGGRSSLTLLRSVMERNHEGGVFVGASDAVVEDSVIQDSLPQAVDGDYGDGISAVAYIDGQLAVLDVRRCMIRRNHSIGVMFGGASGTVTQTAVLDTYPEQTATAHGFGIAVVSHALLAAPISVEVRSSVIERASVAGAAVFHGSFLFADSAIRDTAAEGASGLFGDGIVASSDDAQLPALLMVERSTIARSARVAVASFGANTVVTRATLECNRIDLTGEDLGGITFSFQDGGDNRCGCEGDQRVCRVSQAEVEPPEPPTTPFDSQQP